MAKPVDYYGAEFIAAEKGCVVQGRRNIQHNDTQHNTKYATQRKQHSEC
jgi:hypothetical protein